MIHLRYPEKRGFLTWEELGCLARTLGFQPDMFYKNTPDEFKQEKSGLTNQELLYVLEEGKFFHTDMDCSVNIHTDEWNCSVIRKVLPLLDKRVISFPELHSIRIAFQLYENMDTKGMPVEKSVLQRALKCCRRMISPLKMMQRVKHMKVDFMEEDRIQLDEFLDLLLWCDEYCPLKVEPPNLNSAKDDRNIYQLEDFARILTDYDHDLTAKLDRDYIQQERAFSKEKHRSKQLPKDVPPVDPEPRIQMVRYHKKRYQHLQRAVDQSEKRWRQAKAHHVRDRPVSAPSLSQYRQVESSLGSCALDARPQTVSSLVEPWIRSPSIMEDVTEEQIRSPRSSVAEYHRPKTPKAVSPVEREATSDNIQALAFDLDTVDTKYQIILDEDLDYLLPGFRESKANRKPDLPPPSPPPKPKLGPRPSPEAIDNLYCPPRGHHITHARSCDARFRGWHKVRTQSGSHSVLVSSPVDVPSRTTPRNKQSTGDRIIYRYTGRHDAKPEICRPRTSPEISSRNLDDLLRTQLSTRSQKVAFVNSSSPRVERKQSLPTRYTTLIQVGSKLVTSHSERTNRVPGQYAVTSYSTDVTGMVITKSLDAGPTDNERYKLYSETKKDCPKEAGSAGFSPSETVDQRREGLAEPTDRKEPDGFKGLNKWKTRIDLKETDVADKTRSMILLGDSKSDRVKVEKRVHQSGDSMPVSGRNCSDVVFTANRSSGVYNDIPFPTNSEQTAKGGNYSCGDFKPKTPKTRACRRLAGRVDGMVSDRFRNRLLSSA